MTPVLSLDEVPEHPHHLARGSFVEIDGARFPARRHASDGRRPRWSGRIGTSRTPAWLATSDILLSGDGDRLRARSDQRRSVGHVGLRRRQRRLAQQPRHGVLDEPVAPTLGTAARRRRTTARRCAAGREHRDGDDGYAIAADLDEVGLLLV